MDTNEEEDYKVRHSLKEERELCHGLNHKQILFAQFYAKEHNQVKAYRDAGYTGVNGAHVMASRALKNVKIRALIDHYEEDMRRFAKVTRESIATYQMELAELARKKGDHATAKPCMAEVSKLTGTYTPEQNDVLVVDERKQSSNDLSDDLLEALFDKRKNDEDSSTAVH